MRLIFDRPMIGHLGPAVDGHEVVLAGAGEVDVAHLDHLVRAHLVVDQRQLGESGVVESGKDLVNVHLGDAVRRLREAVVGQVEAQRVHHLHHQALDALVLLLAAQAVVDHGRLEPLRDQRVAHQGRLGADLRMLG